MHQRIPIDLRGGSLKDAGLDTLGKPQAVDGPQNGSLHGLDRIVLVMGGRCRTGKVVNPINLVLEVIDDIVTHQFKARIVDEMLDIDLSTGKKIIQTDDFVSLGDQAFAEVGTKESGSAGNEDTHGEKAKS